MSDAMRSDILRKLSKHLELAHRDEAWITYLMIQVRKVREEESWQPDSPALHLYCNWTAHIRLVRGASVERIIKLAQTSAETFDRLSTLGEEAKEGLTRKELENQLELANFFSLATLRSELRTWLESHGLRQDLCEDDKQWNEFVVDFRSIIKDNSLEIKGNKRVSLSVQKIVVHTEGSYDDEDGQPRLVWLTYLVDGRVSTFSTLVENAQLMSIPRLLTPRVEES